MFVNVKLYSVSSNRKSKCVTNTVYKMWKTGSTQENPRRMSNHQKSLTAGWLRWAILALPTSLLFTSLVIVTARTKI